MKTETAAELAPPPKKETEAPLSDTEILEDLLASQQQIAAFYSDAAASCTAGALKNDMLSVLREEYNLHTTVLDELTARGKYKPSPAPQSKIDEVRQEFTQEDKS